jgi:uracil-DNA glycosylase family 4
MKHGGLSSEQHGILRAMDIPVWVQRQPEPTVESLVNPIIDPIVDPVVDPVVDPGGSEPAPGWAGFAEEVAACTRCDLHRSRRQTVFGVGNQSADWMIIGEAPGADEDRVGEPFVGKAGKLLNEMLRAVGLAREDVYIANILKCRPPNNSDPEAVEVEACAGYLNRQVELISPRLILAVGRIAAQNLLHDDRPVGKMRGSVHRFGRGNIPVIVTYHPAYLLRSPAQKRKAWADLCLARGVANSVVDGLES